MNDAIFVKRIFSKPPAIFPWLGVFQLAMTLHAVWTLLSIPVTQIDWLRPLSLAIYTTLWFIVCDMKRWAAIGYTVMTAACILMRFYAAPDTALSIFGDAFFPVDILMCFFIMYFFRKFE